jgi:predicted outer membrane repeat protein
VGGAEIYTSTFKNNTAKGGFGQGGAIWVSQSILNIYTCTFESNSAANTGGAVCVLADTQSLIQDTIFGANNATSGGAIHVTAAVLATTTVDIYTDCNFTEGTQTEYDMDTIVQTDYDMVTFKCPGWKKGDNFMRMIQKYRNTTTLPPQIPVLDCTRDPVPSPIPPPVPSHGPKHTSWFHAPAVVAPVLIAVVIGLVLLAAVAHKIFGKKRPDGTAANTAQHLLLAKDAATSYSYLIDHSAIKLEPNGVIGSGAEGFVMRGKFNGAQVAVKIITLGMNENRKQSVVTEATQEVKLLQQLHHPNIVQLFGLAIKDTSMDTKLMLVMECCVRSLQDHLKDGRNGIQPVEVIGFLLDTCRGMMYLHSHGIIHRDLKPGNLLLSSDSSRSCRFTVKVADFGGSRFAQNADESDFLTMTAGMGTPVYEAPECISGAGRTSKYSNAVDVYSFALTAWACVNRDTPFATEAWSPWELRGKIADGVRPKIVATAFDCYVCSDMDFFVFKGPQAISKYTSLEAIVKKAWSADPQERPSFEELEPALRALSLAIGDEQKDQEGGERAPHRLTEVAFRRIPVEGPSHCRALST